MDYVVVVDDPDWRNHLNASARQVILGKLVQALARHLPPDTTKSFVERWEADIYDSATTERDYLLEIISKIVTAGLQLEDETIANSTRTITTTSAAPRGRLSVEQESVKRKLPVVEFGEFLRKSKRKKVEEADSTCPVCLECLKTTDEIRELSRCSHVFPKGVWIGGLIGTGSHAHVVEHVY
ncbi:hypothetical protein MKW94_004295 [Papaver nudicaule]|uniref:Mediator complex subunit 15 KIX domain-containing protein n=1 Tax=Papaver nudicaule TaxID=74823 RepID=A0AA41VV76_PAPNU|nr:hypothetical protein [Papaver nudicaule]